MDRIYETVIAKQILTDEQMIFLSGPRRVGKTTLSLSAQKLTDNFIYLNWDNQDHRKIIIKGPAEIEQHFELNRTHHQKSIIVFDEIHKYRRWKNFLKGFFDSYKDRTRIIVTGSSKLNIFKRGGDSLMGRYFPYRIHPFSVAECLSTELPEQEIRLPQSIAEDTFQSLFNFGGFPEPFLKKDKHFFHRWINLRFEQLFREDIRDLSRIQEISQLEILAELLRNQVGQLINYTNLANKVNVSVDTIRRWIKTLSAFYYCFTINPWAKNISRTLIKTPKIFLWDWSQIEEPGAKAENFVASHLLKAIHFWTDYGFGRYGLYFIRDKEKREVDFLVTKNQKPWFLVEVKNSKNNGLNKNLAIFQLQTKASHAFQVAFDMEEVKEDCFKYKTPIIVPVQTFLSQLI